MRDGAFLESTGGGVLRGEESPVAKAERDVAGREMQVEQWLHRHLDLKSISGETRVLCREGLGLDMVCSCF